jgi:hypothetical protein
MSGQVELVRFSHCSQFDLLIIFTRPPLIRIFLVMISLRKRPRNARQRLQPDAPLRYGQFPPSHHLHRVF